MPKLLSSLVANNSPRGNDSLDAVVGPNPANGVVSWVPRSENFTEQLNELIDVMIEHRQPLHRVGRRVRSGDPPSPTPTILGNRGSGAFASPDRPLLPT